MTRRRVHDGNHWLVGLTVSLLLTAAIAGIVPVQSVSAQPAPTDTPSATSAPTETATALATDTPTDTPTATATEVPPPPLLTITKVADNATITAGDQIGFTITITSTGNGDASTVVLLDVLSQLNLPSAPAWTESPDNPFCLFDPSFDLHCQFGTIASGAPPITVHITAPTTEQDCGEVVNFARLEFSDFLVHSPDASVTINCSTSTPTLTATATAVPATEEPAATAPATATSDTTGGVTELPDTGGGSSSGSGQGQLWLLLALFVATGIAIGGIRARQRR